jgi:alpha-beta hydrolase superfamily lysophospholipase
MEEQDGTQKLICGNYPSMIFCNPNAGFAEFFQYQSDWLDYYHQMGINVFVWNYRGFGLSEGDPSPRVSKKY